MEAWRDRGEGAVDAHPRPVPVVRKPRVQAVHRPSLGPKQATVHVLVELASDAHEIPWFGIGRGKVRFGLVAAPDGSQKRKEQQQRGSHGSQAE